MYKVQRKYVVTLVIILRHSEDYLKIFSKSGPAQWPISVRI